MMHAAKATWKEKAKTCTQPTRRDMVSGSNRREPAEVLLPLFRIPALAQNTSYMLGNTRSGLLNEKKEPRTSHAKK
jgi:hypothetical protein